MYDRHDTVAGAALQRDLDAFQTDSIARRGERAPQKAAKAMGQADQARGSLGVRVDGTHDEGHALRVPGGRWPGQRGQGACGVDKATSTEHGLAELARLAWPGGAGAAA